MESNVETDAGATQETTSETTPEPVTETEGLTMMIYKYESPNEPQQVKIEKEMSYRELLGNEDNKFIVVLKKENETPTIDTSITYDSMITPTTEKQTIGVFTYKYTNIVDNEELVADLGKIPITNDDLSNDTEIIDVSFLGNKVMETNNYIDSDGILRIFDETINKISKVLIVDVPNNETGSSGENNENQFLMDATSTLNSLGNLLQKIKEILPKYMVVELDGKKFVISKDNSYIVTDKK